MPALGRERDECAPGIRSYPVNSHLVFYLQRDEILYVVRVLHSRQDPDAVDWEEAMIGSD